MQKVHLWQESRLLNYRFRNMKNINYLLLLILGVFIMFGCEKETNDTPVDEMTIPEIVSITATKDVVMFGGKDPTTINCEADGGDLTYTWYVDLGDLIPMNEDRSSVQYTASDCCIGDKLITCTVENELGSVTDTISIYILYE